MTKLTRITRGDCDVVRRAVVAALAGVEEQFGLKLVTKPGRFSDTSFTFPIEFATVGGEGIVNSLEAENFRRQSHRFGVPADALGTTITLSNGREFKLTGMDPRRRKFPFTGEEANGCRSSISAQSVKYALATANLTQASVKAAMENLLKPKATTFEPSAGDKVKARWTDGEWYDAKFVRYVGIGGPDVVAVEFEDGSRFRCKLQDLKKG